MPKRTKTPYAALGACAVEETCAGNRPQQSAAALSMGHVTLRAAIKAIDQGAAKALLPKRTCRPVGSSRRLSAEQELHIQRQICKQRPEQLKLEFALWSRAAVMQLVQQEFGIELLIRTMGEYLKRWGRWGFTPQRPFPKAYEQRPEAVKQWLDEQYPVIADRAKAEDAEIHWSDEAAVVNTDVRGRSYQPQRPDVPPESSRANTTTSALPKPAITLMCAAST